MLVPVLIVLMQPTAPAAPAPAPPPAATAPKSLHPMITEILYAVPKEGDADQDGTRSATGDEFIELVNPHDKPINLKGYTLTDGKSQAQAKQEAKPAETSKPDAKGKPKKEATGHRPEESRVRFTFPELTLQPGEVVVVFNGYESHTPGPVGDTKAAAAKNDKFSNAYVFSMHCTSQYMALANAGDCVLLTDPEGNAVESVSWGDTTDKKPDKPAPVTHKAPESRGSVQKTSVSGEFVVHQDLPGLYAGTPWSPGKFDLPKK
jgi:cell wall-associated NlpC family hydrolase